MPSPFNSPVSTRHGLLALSPVAVFVLVYVVVSVVVGDFYKMPIAVAMIIASVWAIAIFRGHSLAERIDIFSREAAKGGIMYMVWVFVLAGAFSAIAKATGAVESTVNFTLYLLPDSFIIPGLFIAACFISMSIGTSVGTVVALAPLAVEVARAGAGPTELCVAAVLGGAFFGDNLSFISDTTIAATRSQGTDMRAKFRANIAIVLPAAIATLIVYLWIGSAASTPFAAGPYNPWLIVPYIVVIVLALFGINVTVVLCAGIVTALVIGMCTGHELLAMASSMGEGIDSMGNLIVITLLAAGMLGVIKAMGGINYLIQTLSRHISGVRGAQGVIVALVGLVNVCTANNTIAIITVGSLAREIAERFGITRRRAASLLDTGSCIVQCLLPYGAQTLLAASLADISPVAMLPYLYYPMVLALTVGISIALGRGCEQSVVTLADGASADLPADAAREKNDGKFAKLKK